MQQDNNIANKLRQLDDEQQPDLGNMDAHWQQMQAMLQPVAVPVKKGIPKWMLNALSVTAVVILISSAFFYLAKTKKVNEAATVPMKEVPAEKSTAATTVVNSGDSAEPLMVVTTAVPYIQINDQGNGKTDDNNYPDVSTSILDSMKINFTACDACPSKKTDSGVVTSVNRKMLLDNLFTQLQKEEQHFVIANSRDTLLQFREGTALLIPATSLGGMDGIELTAKEFYKTSDIILNQLTTASNKAQLVTGGMLQMKAVYKGNEVKIDKQKPLILYMQDTGINMEGMQLFTGTKQTVTNPLQQNYAYSGIQDTPSVTGAPTINWQPSNQYFSRNRLVTEVRVFNIMDEPFEVHYPLNDPGRRTAYFVVSDSITVERKKLKAILKEKYGYYKIRLRSDIRNWFKAPEYNRRNYNRDYATRIGDSLWMDKKTADKYNLTGTAVRRYVVNDNNLFTSNKENKQFNNWLTLSDNSDRLVNDISNKYGVSIDELGWINCDRFYSDSRNKINFSVDLGDLAANYYTMLVFDSIKSMMSGYADGSKVVFQNIPIGEPVTIISVGINTKGETVYSLTNTTASKQELTGLRFESVSAPDLKTALGKMDK